MSWGGDGGWGQPPVWSVGGWLVVVGLLLLGAAVALLVVYIHRAGAAGRRTGSAPTHSARAGCPEREAQAQRPGETALDLLQRRYASGLIERDDYLARCADLRQTRRSDGDSSPPGTTAARSA